MPSRIPILLSYKVMSYFGPSFRGRFGPGPYIGLMLLLGLYGLLGGFGIGYLLGTYNPAEEVNFLGAALATTVSFGFVFALGAGALAIPSELDFVMTAPVKSREWLISDMLFMFSVIMLAGGFAGLLAALGLVIALDLSVMLALLLLLLFAAFLFLVFMTIQIILVLRIRHPRAHVGTVTVVLLVLSMIPSISLVSPDFPIQFAGLPIPQAAFAEVAYDILNSNPPSVEPLVYSLGWFAGIAVLWYALSDKYIFYGIKPTLSAGFGQVDLRSRMAQQRRIMTALSGVTTLIRLRPDTGSDVGFMTRFHLIRVWRDGTILFVLLMIVLFVVPSFFSSAAEDRTAQTSQASMQIMTLPIAILAVTWSYYERENLWVVVTSGRSVVDYFRGMMLGFAALVMIVAGTLVVVLEYVTGVGLSASDLALPIISPIVGSIAATSMLTRVKILPAAFSPSILIVLLGTIIAGFAGGFVIQTLIGATESLGTAVQLVELGGIAIALALLGEALVGSLAKGFRF
jgi:hypothetical protein